MAARANGSSLPDSELGCWHILRVALLGDCSTGCRTDRLKEKVFGLLETGSSVQELFISDILPVVCCAHVFIDKINFLSF